jgi:hypothetical protein
VLHDKLLSGLGERVRLQVLLDHEHAVRIEWPVALRSQLGIMRDSPWLAAGVVQECPYLTGIWAQDALVREGLLHVVPG